MTKALVVLVAILATLPLGGVLARLRAIVRDSLVFGLVLFLPYCERLDANLFGRPWYRGTTRGIEVSIVDLIALTLLVSLVVRGEGKRRGALLWPSVLFVLYASVHTFLVADPWLFSTYEWSKLLRGILFLALGGRLFGTARNRSIFAAAAWCSVALQAGLAFYDRYVLHIHRVVASFPHPNSLSMYLCSLSPLVVVLFARARSWRAWALHAGVSALGVVAVVLTISRMGFVVVGANAVLAWALGRRKWLSVSTLSMAICLSLAGGLVVHKAWDTLASRYSEASLEEEYLSDDPTKGRGVYLNLARAIIRSHPLGVGLNNWSYAVSNRFGPEIGMGYIPYEGTEVAPVQEIPYNSGLDAAQAAPAHSLTALTLGELGYPGLLLFAIQWMFWSWIFFQAAWRQRKNFELDGSLALGVALGFLAVFLQSLTEWEFRQTPLFLHVHLLVGLAANLGDREPESGAPSTS